jgi:hypothetical protein
VSEADLLAPPAGLRLADAHRSPSETIAAADHAARHWQSQVAGPLIPGTPIHKAETARMFRDTFNPYKPTIIDWPRLDPEARDRLITLPIWDIAVQTEGKARIRMLSYAHSLTDPVWLPPTASRWNPSRPTRRRATPNGPTWSPASASASTASSPSACSRSPKNPASSPPRSSTPSSR